jgi:hypothetical protein
METETVPDMMSNLGAKPDNPLELAVAEVVKFKSWVIF